MKYLNLTESKGWPLTYKGNLPFLMPNHHLITMDHLEDQEDVVEDLQYHHLIDEETKASKPSRSWKLSKQMPKLVKGIVKAKLLKA